MSDLAERIRELAKCPKESGWDEAWRLIDGHAPTILAGLAALEEREKLREALESAGGVLTVTAMGMDNGDFRRGLLFAAAQQCAAALQPTPEEPV